MTLALFAASRYLIVFFFCLTAYVIGRTALRRLPFANRAEEISLCTALGLGILAQAILLIGLFHWLTTTGVLVVIVFSIVMTYAIRRLRPRDSFARPPLSSLTLAVIAVLGILALAAIPLFLLPLYPPTDFDETMYHLAVAKTWIQVHAIVPTPFLRAQVLPYVAHALFAALMILKDDIAAQILSLAATILIGIGLFGWGARVRGPACGALAAALWFGSPAVLSLAGVASYHALSTLFCSTALLSLANYATAQEPIWLLLAAALIGFAESTWSLTIYFVPVFATTGFYFMLKERSLRPIYLMLAGILIGWGPCLARSLYYTGNPTYPLFSSVFGTGPWWTSADLASMAGDIHRFGVARTILNFCTLPYWLFFRPDKFQSAVSFSGALFLFLPLVVFRLLFDKYTRWLAAIFTYYLICWFIFGQVMRYLLPIAPLLCVLSASCVVYFIDLVVPTQSQGRVVLLILLSTALLLPGLAYSRQTIATDGSVPLSPKQRETYLSNKMPGYPALAAANFARGPIYSLFGTNEAYYADGPFLGDWFGPGRYSTVLEAMRNGTSLYDCLHRFGVKYFLVNRSEAIVPPLPYDDPDFDRHFQLLFANSVSELYRLVDKPLPLAPNHSNLLRNPDFDQLAGRWPVDWAHGGNPAIGAPPMGADSGSVAVRVTQSDTFSQAVRVQSSQIYELRLKAVQAGPEGLFRLQVNWIDQNGKICDVFIRVYKAEAAWKMYSGVMISPACAQTADVYASGQTDTAVWLDSFLFRRATTAGEKMSQTHSTAP